MTDRMIFRRRGGTWMQALIASLAITGCASSGGSMPSVDASQQLITEARHAVLSGARTRAQSLLEEATRSRPADKQPWVQLAQLHFEQGQYASAITAGQEVLARDAGNLDARSIVLVSSLRLAARSLEELSASNQLAGDTRTEARKVAHLLRETLGETVLVPANKSTATADPRSVDDAGAEKTPGRRPVKSARSKPEMSRSVVSAPSRTNSSAGSGGDSDPFRSLR